MNTCVGDRNYRYFIAFIVNLASLGVCDILGLVLFLFYDTDDDLNHEKRSFVKNEGLIVTIIAVIGISSIFVTILVVLL